MKDNRYYFLLGFMSAMLFATVFVGCTSPLTAHQFETGISELGSSRFNPLYVVVIDE